MKAEGESSHWKRTTGEGKLCGEREDDQNDDERMRAGESAHCE